jgi:hypothetical protein
MFGVVAATTCDISRERGERMILGMPASLLKTRRQLLVKRNHHFRWSQQKVTVHVVTIVRILSAGDDCGLQGNSIVRHVVK